MAQTTHFNKVSGVNGLYVGPNGSEVQVASSTGALYQSGTQVTASAAELNIMDGVTATAAELNQYVLTAYLADANTASTAYVVAPHAGTLATVAVVPYANNGTAATVFTASIAGSAVTHPALSIASDGTAGTASSVAPTAANAVTAGQVISLASDGGGATVMPVMISLTITR